MKKGNNNNDICTYGDFKELKKIRDFIFEKALVFGFVDEKAQEIVLAVDEACTNLIRHAFRNDASKKICVKIETGNNLFTVNIFDDAPPFNPLDVPFEDMKEYFRTFKKGGLGVQIMRKVMDKIEYYPSSDKNPTNHLILKKLLL